MIGGLGLAFEALDAGIIAFIIPSLRTQWGLSTGEIGWIASSTYVGFLVGALFSGILGDRYGRKKIMMWPCCCSAWPRSSTPSLATITSSTSCA
ncbi:Putative niacin/nicotinamide transporter NaiP [Achromobacter denitrificans]|nr:Putative niacin/nicotinamide transporter NaiP [Achromobacter denitrificans]